jgi:acetoin utilization protein AcuB
MYAQRILTTDLPTARPDDVVGRVLELMDEYKVRQLPLADHDAFMGLVFEDDLLEAEETTPMALLQGKPVFAVPHLHLYDVVATMVRSELDMLPVVKDGKYLGSIHRASILKFLAEDSGWGHPGGTIVVEVPEVDLSVSELARIVESNGARILAYTLAAQPEHQLVEVTFKLNSQDVEPILDALQRFGYAIQTFFHSPELEEEMRERYEAFMRYLNT